MTELLQAEGGGRGEELKGAWAWYEDRVPDVLCQLYGWGPLGGGHGGSCDGRSTGRLTAPTRHARCVAPGGKADGVANERLSSLASDAVWQIRSIGRIWAFDGLAQLAAGLDVGGEVAQAPCQT